jgi:hypothetical protein
VLGNALVGKDADGRRDRHVDGEESGDLVLPIQTSRRSRCVGQPARGDIVKDVVACEFPRGFSLNDLAHEPGLTGAVAVIDNQAARPTGESASPYSVCGRVPIMSA